MSKFLLSYLVLLLAGRSLFAENTPTKLTSQDAASIALENNRDLAAARFAVQQAEGRLKQAGLWPNPDFELSRQRDTPFANEGEYSFSAGFKQRFPITGRLQKAKAVGRVDVALAWAEIRNRERLLIGEVLAKSRSVLVLKELLKTSDDTAKFLEQLVQVSEKRLTVAEVSVTDVNLAKLELQRLRLAQNQFQIEQSASLSELNRLLGRDAKEPLEIIGELNTAPLPTSLNELRQKVLALRPDRQQAILSIDRGAAEVKLARALKWEDWSVGFDYSRDRQVFNAPVGNKEDQFVGLSLSIPLPLWNKNQGRIAEARATEERAKAELAALDLTILAEVQIAFNRVEQLQPLIQQYRQETLKLAEDNIVLLQKGYAQGLVSISLIIQAQQQLATLRQSFWETVGQFARAQTDLETASATSPFLKSQSSNKP
ncbi:MAG: TolC family protein [Verrucomicrobiota bacterium]